MTHTISAEFLLHLLTNAENTVLLENTQADPQTGQSMLFHDPVKALCIYRIDEFDGLLASIEEYTRQGFYVAGYFTYECAYHITKLAHPDYMNSDAPLAWFGVYTTPLTFTPNTLDLSPESAATRSMVSDDNTPHLAHEVRNLHFNLAADTYMDSIARIQEYIRSGDVYQLNFTGRYTFDLAGSPLSLYLTLRKKQRTQYSAFLNTPDQHILSLSPELFFSLDQEEITTRPMKGTAMRGRTLLEDEGQAAWLQQDSKNRAENVMIVDLLRNDLGRICRVGSVTVPDLFTIERYQTLLQMTSTVKGTLPTQDTTYSKTIRSLFPCGSITGAPKIRAMSLIEELETTPRGVYTGSIGYFAPVQPRRPPHAVFNVAIRTVVVDKWGQGTMGVGSGIVIDSDPASEYQECLLKARFLTEPAIEFDLLESLLWQNGYKHLEAHLRRMQESARYFQRPFDYAAALVLLKDTAAPLLTDTAYKVRLLLTEQGTFSCSATPLPNPAIDPVLPIVALSTTAIDTQDRFYYHKTTHRPLYTLATARAHALNLADVIFTNERGEITEGAISNVLLERAGQLYTPPLTSGLLNGIYRQHLLATLPNLHEAVLLTRDLSSADKIYLCNSVRGLREVCLQQEAIDL